ncbi:MAG: Ig-like domain-containing protein [Leptolyngbyaceae cyanobacterium]
MAILQGTFTVPFFAPGTGIFFVDDENVTPDGFQQVIPLVDPDGDGPLNAIEFTIAGTTFTEDSTLVAPTAVFNSGELAGITFSPSPLLEPPIPAPFISININQALATATTSFGPQEATVEYGPLTPPPPPPVPFASTFTVDGGDLDGETGDFSFLFDESQVPATGTVNIPLEFFEFNLAGETLTLADDADGANVQFENGEFNGFDFATTNVPATDTFFSVSFEVGANGPDFGSFALLDNSFNLVDVEFTEPVPDDGGNTAPTAGDDSFTTDEDNTLAGDVAGNDSDPEGDALTFSLNSNVSNGALSFNDDGSFSYTPDTDFNGSDSFTYDVTDGEFTDTATVDITVAAVNDAPVAADDTAETAEEAIAEIAVLANDTDVDGDALSIDSVGDAANGSVNIDGSNIFYSPDTGFSGTDSFTYVVSDGNGGTDEATVTVTVAADPNVAPIAADDTFNVDEDASLSDTVAANDSDADGDDLIFSVDSFPSDGELVFNDDGSFEYFPNADFNGADSFTYTVSDGELTDSATVDITVNAVNDAPVAADDAAATGESTTATIAVLGNDSDVDGDDLFVDAVGAAANGTVVINDDGTVAYTPDDGFSGEDSFTYTVSDGNGGTDTATVTVTVSADPTNAPVAEDDAFSTDEDTALSDSVAANDSDADGDDLTFSLSADVSSGTLSFNADGSFDYTPDADFNGTDSFTYEVSDGEFSDVATATITVAPVNDEPIANDDAASTGEGVTVEINALANDTDVDGDALSIDEVGVPVNGNVSVEGDSIFYTPNNGFTGTDTFSYTIADGNGGTSTANVTVTVSGDPNAAPVAIDDAFSTDEDTVLSGDVSTNDSDADGDNLAFALVSEAADGAVSVNADGTFSYTPNADFNGSDSFVYEVTDGQLAATATATITVAPINDAPVAANDTANTVVDTPVTIDVLDNDADVDGDVLSAAPGAAANGTVTLNEDGTVSYTPNAGFSGTDSFTYVVSDGELTDEATVTVTVNTLPPDNEPPVAVDDSFTTFVDTPVEGNVAGNDSDPDGDALTFSLLTDAGNGAVSFNTDGSFSYTPAAGFEGSDSFTYEVSDGEFTDTATVDLTVNPDVVDVDVEIALVDAETDTILQSIGEGAEITVSSADNLSLAVFIPEESPFFDSTSSVLLDLNDGDITRRENAEPYALFGDFMGDFGGGELPVGANSLALDFFTENGLRGDLIGSVTRNFTLIEEGLTGDAVTVGLFDTETDTLIETIENGAEIVVDSTQNLTIAAFVNEDSARFGQVESVFLNLNEGEITRQENAEPYALFGDIGGDFRNGSLPVGNNTLELELFSKNGLKGDLLETVALDFTLVEQTV